MKSSSSRRRGRLTHDEHGRSAGEAVKIFHKVGSSKLSSVDSDEEKRLIESIFQQKEVADKPVAIFSIAGAFRQGKSFLLNLLLRYLKALTKGNAAKWLADENVELGKEFAWKPGVEQCTQGVWIWSEPFVINTAQHGEVAVFLMDTQGVFDHESDMTDDTTIFALSTLISSVQIYNLLHQIQEDALQFLQLFVDYGRSALSGPATSRRHTKRKAFQKLLFLLRDWPHKNNYHFGSEGGRNYLKKVLNEHQSIDNSGISSVRKDIGEAFDTVDCYLMPSPCEAVREGEALKVKDVDKRFLKWVYQLASQLFDPQKIEPKMINGKPVRGKELSNYLYSYYETLKSGKAPKVETLLKATANGVILTIVDESNVIYSKEMEKGIGKGFAEEEILDKIHDAALTKALTWYDEQRKLGDRNFVEENRKKVRLVVEENYKGLRQGNQLEREKLERSTQELLEKAKMKIEQLLKNKANDPPIPQEDTVQYYQQCEDQACHHFLQLATHLPKSVEEKFQNILRREVKGLLEEFESANGIRLKLRSQKELQLEEYLSEMDGALGSSANVHALDDAHKKLMNACLRKYRTLVQSSHGDFANIKKELKQSIEKHFQQIVRPRYLETQGTHSAKLIEIRMNYGKEMKLATSGSYVTKSSLKRKHEDLVQKFTKKAKLEFPGDDDLTQQFLDNIGTDLQDNYLSVQQSNQVKRFRFVIKRTALSAAAGLATGCWLGAHPSLAAVAGGTTGYYLTKKL